jgi:hypothetical protein
MSTMKSNQMGYHWVDDQDRMHRIGGPAFENFCWNQDEWYEHGKKHREDGPAVDDWYTGDRDEFWYDGIEVTKSELKKIVEVKDRYAQSVIKGKYRNAICNENILLGLNKIYDNFCNIFSL